MKTTQATDEQPDPYEEYRSRYKSLMTSVARVLRQAGSFRR